MSTKAEEISAIVRGRIRTGQYQPNKRIPSQSEMADEFGVSGRTIAKAIADLRDRGYLVTLPHKGSFSRPSDHWRDVAGE